MRAGLRLMIYDATCARRRGLVPGLSPAWGLGARLYGALGRLDAWRGAARWDEGLRWIAEADPARPIDEVQLWMHGRWGRALIGAESLDLGSFAPRHPHRQHLEALRERLHRGSLLWLRTCESFGAEAGHDLARALADFFGCRVAGHTHVIADWQSGLHSLRPGEAPSWSSREGLAAGTPEAPRRALASAPWRPNTIHCLTGRVPAGF